MHTLFFACAAFRIYMYIPCYQIFFHTSRINMVVTFVYFWVVIVSKMVGAFFAKDYLQQKLIRYKIKTFLKIIEFLIFFGTIYSLQ